MAQVINNKIFDSTVAADGAWRNISNFTTMSVHLTNVEGKVWIEVSNEQDPNNLDRAEGPIAPPAHAGLNASGNLPSSPIVADEIEIVQDLTTKQAVWAPSCLVWNWIRVRKDATAQTLETKAFLFGQNG